MVYESELIKYGKIKVEDIFRKELLECYAVDYNIMLLVPNSPKNIYYSDEMSNYKVKEIIENCSVITGQRGSGSTHSHCDSIIIIEKV